MMKYHENVQGRLIVDEDRIINPRPGDRSIVQLPIKELPDCYEKERLSELALSVDETVYVVARCGQVLDWSAYIGWPKHLSPIGEENDPAGYYRARVSSAEGVASYGDKLGCDTAQALFPEWSRYSYRR